jgi:hypothetical protein
MNIPDEAKCEKRALHSFVPKVSNSYVIAETCEFCGEKVQYSVVNGRIDNNKYARDHFRDFLRPTGEGKELFIKTYGIDSYRESVVRTNDERSKKPKEELIRERVKEAMDMYRTLGRTSVTF